MLAVTIGYLFLPVVRAEHMARLRTALKEDSFVEGAYLVGAVVEEEALAAGGEGLKALSIRGGGARRAASSSHPSSGRYSRKKVGTTSNPWRR
jgi:hypothetical protein